MPFDASVEYTEAYEDSLGATSTKKSPWYIVPADHKWVARTAVAAITPHANRALDLTLPEPTPKQVAAMAASRAQLEMEGGPRPRAPSRIATRCRPTRDRGQSVSHATPSRRRRRPEPLPRVATKPLSRERLNDGRRAADANEGSSGIPVVLPVLACQMGRGRGKSARLPGNLPVLSDMPD
jgi:hypothetical protein